MTLNKEEKEMKPTLYICKTCKRPTTNANRYCDQHQGNYKEARKQYDDYRGSPSKRGYDAAWRKFRDVFVKKHPLCGICQKEGRISPTEEVHHIVPLSEGGARLDQNNCQALCKSCHSRITAQGRKNS